MNKKTGIQNIFFSLRTTRLSSSLEGLNNSLAQSAGVEYIHPRLAFAGVEFLLIFGFTVIILAPDLLAS